MQYTIYSELILDRVILRNHTLRVVERCNIILLIFIFWSQKKQICLGALAVHNLLTRWQHQSPCVVFKYCISFDRIQHRNKNGALITFVLPPPTNLDGCFFTCVWLCTPLRTKLWVKFHETVGMFTYIIYMERNNPLTFG